MVPGLRNHVNLLTSLSQRWLSHILVQHSSCFTRTCVSNKVVLRYAAIRTSCNYVPQFMVNSDGMQFTAIVELLRVKWKHL